MFFAVATDDVLLVVYNCCVYSFCVVWLWWLILRAGCQATWSRGCRSGSSHPLWRSVGNKSLLDLPRNAQFVHGATVVWFVLVCGGLSCNGLSQRKNGVCTILLVGVPKTQTVVLRLLAATNAAHPISTESVSGKISVLSSLAAAVRRATVAADEPER